MKEIKRFLAVVLAMVICFSNVSVANAASFATGEKQLKKVKIKVTDYRRQLQVKYDGRQIETLPAYRDVKITLKFTDAEVQRLLQDNENEEPIFQFLQVYTRMRKGEEGNFEFYIATGNTSFYSTISVKAPEAIYITRGLRQVLYFDKNGRSHELDYDTLVSEAHDSPCCLSDFGKGAKIVVKFRTYPQFPRLVPRR